MPYGSKRYKIERVKWRDLLKSAVIRLVGNTCIVLIGVENQSDVHYAMPVKNMLYDVVNYGSQVKETARKHKENRDRCTGAEFLSGFHKEDRLMPVVTITVYWGAEEWDAPRSLHEMFGEMDEGLKRFVPDYHINAIIPREVEDFGKFRTSLGAVLEMIRASGDQEEMERLLQTNERYSHMDNESVAAINTFIGTDIPLDTRKGETNMCKAWADQKKEGRKEGAGEERLAAIRNMIKYGVPKNQILQDYAEEEYERAQSSMMNVGTNGA